MLHNCSTACKGFSKLIHAGSACVHNSNNSITLPSTHHCWNQIHSRQCCSSTGPAYLGSQMTLVTPRKRLSRASMSDLLSCGLRLGCSRHSSVVRHVLCGEGGMGDTRVVGVWWGLPQPAEVLHNLLLTCWHRQLRAYFASHVKNASQGSRCVCHGLGLCPSTPQLSSLRQSSVLPLPINAHGPSLQHKVSRHIRHPLTSCMP
jgi:hypothetical protein